VSFWQTMVAVHREAMRAVGGREVATAVDDREAATVRVEDPQPGNVAVGGDAVVVVVVVVVVAEMRAINKVARATTVRHGRGDRRPAAKTARK